MLGLWLARVLAFGGAPRLVAAYQAAKTVWTFESDEPGKAAKGFTSESGTWEVARDGQNNVLAQKGKSDDRVFKPVLADGTHYKDLDINVRLKAVAGELDRGEGLVWRARDKSNYHIARYNPLENNFRLNKVQDGKRTQFQSADTPGATMWHTLRVTMTGNTITCYLDGKKHLEFEDSTFAEGGKIGLWFKSDSQSYFDDVTVSGTVE
jgi:hypothetical protein